LVSRSLSKVHIDIDISLLLVDISLLSTVHLDIDISLLLVDISLPLKGSYRYRYLVVVG